MPQIEPETRIKVTIIESPYFNRPDACRYLACCILDVLQRGESPLASHAILPLALGEHTPPNADGLSGRERGLAAWREVEAHVTRGSRNWGDVHRAYYCDGYPSEGMLTKALEANNCPSVVRRLEGEARAIWERGDWPSPARLTPNHGSPEGENPPEMLIGERSAWKAVLESRGEVIRRQAATIAELEASLRTQLDRVAYLGSALDDVGKLVVMRDDQIRALSNLVDQLTAERDSLKADAIMRLESDRRGSGYGSASIIDDVDGGI